MATTTLPAYLSFRPGCRRARVACPSCRHLFLFAPLSAQALIFFLPLSRTLFSAVPNALFRGTCSYIRPLCLPLFPSKQSSDVPLSYEPETSIPALFLFVLPISPRPFPTERCYQLLASSLQRRLPRGKEAEQERNDELRIATPPGVKKLLFPRLCDDTFLRRI